MTIGDIVRLRSGGPKMVVATADHVGNFRCCWFDVNHQFQVKELPYTILELVEDEQEEVVIPEDEDSTAYLLS